MPALSWQAAALVAVPAVLLAYRRGSPAGLPAVLLAYLAYQWLSEKPTPPEAWSELVLPSQALWGGIPSYYRHPTLPILTFRTAAGAGLGDPLTMAAVASRFEPRPSDVHIVTYPKAGTSWIQEVAWLVNHDADFERSTRVPSSQRTVYIEADFGADKLTQLETATGPRHVKWHHSSDLLPRRVVEEGRIIYLMRNPKDVVVSWYHFQRMNKLYAFTGSFDEFFDHFLDGQVAYGDYWHNVLSWWSRRAQPNVLFLTYEEMHLDLSDVVRRVARFLGKTISEERVAAVADWCTFEQMKQNPATNAASMPKVPATGDFMRKGQVGDWRRYFSDEQSRRMDRWIEENTQEDLPLVFTLDA